MKKLLCIILTVLSVACMLSPAVSAAEFVPYVPYEYNTYGEVVVSPPAYVPYKQVNSADMKLSVPLSAPADMKIRETADGIRINILDSANSRIVELDSEYTVVKIYEKFVMTPGDTEALDFAGATGFAFDENDNIYIADTENERVLVIGENGVVKNIITRPDEALEGTDLPFQPSKIEINADGSIYVIAKSINMGIMVFTKEGEFKRFFANDSVVATAEVIINYLKKKFMTREQIEGIEQFTAAAIANMDIDDNGFVYTVTSDTVSQESGESVRKINFKGSNILAEIIGEEESALADIEIDESDLFFSLLDNKQNKIFQYTIYGDLVGVFGCFSEQQGGFSNACAIESIGEEILVLDSEKNNLQIFRTSEYGSTVREAYIKLYDNQYAESLELWENIRQMNTNSRFPYYGIGLAYDSLGEYKKAMYAFEVGGFNEEYSVSYREYRKEFMADNFILIFAVILFVVLAAVLLIKCIKKLLKRNQTSLEQSKNGIMLYILRHPFDGFDVMHRERRTSPLLGIAIIVLWLLVEIYQYFCFGPSFQNNRATDFQILSVITRTVIMFGLFVGSNWCMATFLEGKGHFDEITCLSAYSLIPFIIARFICVPLSNFLTADEAVFMWVIMAIGIIWSVFMLCVGMVTVHQYSFSRMLISIILTVVCMCVCVLLIILAVNLFQMIAGLIKAGLSEIALR